MDLDDVVAVGLGAAWFFVKLIFLKVPCAQDGTDEKQSEEMIIK